jgi:hypothetical protein
MTVVIVAAWLVVLYFVIAVVVPLLLASVGSIVGWLNRPLTDERRVALEVVEQRHAKEARILALQRAIPGGWVDAFTVKVALGIVLVPGLVLLACTALHRPGAESRGDQRGATAGQGPAGVQESGQHGADAHRSAYRRYAALMLGG